MTLNTLIKQLEKESDKKPILHHIASCCEEHYLNYFMANLSLEMVTYLEMVREKESLNILEMDVELSKIVGFINAELTGISQFITMSQGEKEARIKMYLDLREKLSFQVAALAAYDDRLKQYEYVLNRRRDISTMAPIRAIKDEDLVRELLDFIFQYEDAPTINDRIKSIYSELPVRMSKIKFESWIEQALIGLVGVSKRDFNNYVTYLKETFYPEGVEGYGRVMPSVKETFDEFEVLMTDLIDHSVVGKLEEKISGLKKLLESCVSIYTYTATIINNILGLLFVLTPESLKDNEIAKRRFLNITEHISNRVQEPYIMDEALIELFDEISYFFDDLRMENSRFDQVIEETKKGYLDDILKAELNERFDRLSGLYILQSNSFFAPLEQKLEGFEPMDEVSLLEGKDALLSYLNDASSLDSRIGKRTRMACLFGVLNVVTKTHKEIYDVIYNALVSCKDEREKRGSVQSLYAIISEEY